MRIFVAPATKAQAVRTTPARRAIKRFWGFTENAMLVAAYAMAAIWLYTIAMLIMGMA